MAAYPESVNVLSDIANDVRTPDKLVDGVNETVDCRHMWLAPILPNIVCRSVNQQGHGNVMSRRAVALPTAGLVGQTIHFALPIFLNCIL